MTRIALSASRTNDYKKCPLKYRFRAIDKLPEPSTEAQVKGTLVHAVLEKIHELPREQRTFTTAVAFIEPQWNTMLNADPDAESVISARSDFLNDAWRLIRGYFMMENPQGFDADAVEKYFDITLPNGVPVRGFIDRVDIAPTGEVRVVDYKTGKKPTPRFQEEPLFQMRFYALAYYRMNGVIPEQLHLMYLKELDSLFLGPSKEELEYFEHDLETLWGKITADGTNGTFRPTTSKLCDWCYFQEFCPAFGGTPPEYPGWPDD